MNDKLHVIKMLDMIVEEKKYSNLVINNYFSNNNINKSSKAFINNILNITLKNLIYIDYIISKLSKTTKRYTRQILRVSIAQIIYTNSDLSGIIYEAVEISKIKNEFQGKFVNSFLRSFVEKRNEIEKDVKEHIKLSYPRWFYDKIKVEYGENYLEVLKRYKDKSYFSVRVNHNKISKEKFLEILKKLDTNILFEVNDVYYLDNISILNTKYYLNSDIYIQDGSSNLVCYALNPSENDQILDVAAAPGGKSLAILDRYNPKSLLALDIHKHKVDKLKEYENRYPNFKVKEADARLFNEGSYDKILLDIPCSGLGVLTKKPEKIYNIELKDIKEIKKLQKNIFSNIYKLLRKNGEMVYSTCTILKNENTNNVEYFLEKYKDLEVVEIEFPNNVKVIKDEYGGNLISYENKYLDGFYIIKFKKK